jgi:hypothetical protein
VWVKCGGEGLGGRGRVGCGWSGACRGEGCVGCGWRLGMKGWVRGACWVWVEVGCRVWFFPDI